MKICDDRRNCLGIIWIVESEMKNRHTRWFAGKALHIGQRDNDHIVVECTPGFADRMDLEGGSIDVDGVSLLTHH